jgi:invasion protein IalB
MQRLARLTVAPWSDTPAGRNQMGPVPPMQLIRLPLILAGLGLALASPLAAQEAPAAPAAPAATAPAAPAADAPATDAPAADAPAAAAAPAAPADGTVVPATPAQPEVMEVVRDTFGDWQVRCAPQGDECFLYQLALDAQKNPVAEVSVLKLPEVADAAAGATIVTPLGTLLTQGVVLQIDGGEARQYPFAWCSQVGCFARFGFAQTSIDAMKRGKAAKISLISVAAPEQPVVLDLSLRGFTDAFNSLATPPSPPGAVAAPAAPAPAAPQPAAPLPSLMPRN